MTTLARATLFAACLLAAGLARADSMPSTAEIVQKNAEARGGQGAWHKLQTMAWAGHTESSSAPGRKLPFLLEQKRPNSTRFELMTEGQRSVRAFDGVVGWKLRPSSSGRPEVQLYSDEELRFARGAQVIEGPLMDYASKGALMTLAGVGETEGRKAYVLDVKLPSGGAHKVWVDAETFLELRHDREVRGAKGPSMVTVLFRDYREFEGLQMPTTIETGAAKGQPTSKLVIERVALNPKFDDRMFAKPSTPVARRRSIVVDTRSAAGPGAPKPAGQP